MYKPLRHALSSIGGGCAYDLALCAFAIACCCLINATSRSERRGSSCLSAVVVSAERLSPRRRPALSGWGCVFAGSPGGEFEVRSVWAVGPVTQSCSRFKDQVRNAHGRDGPPRAPSPPRQDAPRQYHDQPQRPPPTPHRGLPPSPKSQPPAPSSYQHGPQHQAPQPPSHHATPSQSHQDIPRLPYGSQPSNAPTPSNGGPGSVGQATLPPYARQQEQQPEIRPLINQAAPSPNGQYPRSAYEHHPNAAPSIASGAPAPSSAQSAADAAAREKEDRPSSTAPPKRPREWDEDPHSVKKPSTDETRSRLDDIKMHRGSPIEAASSPAEPRRVDEPRPTSAYHPSEAAHHPQALPPMHSITQPSPSTSTAPQEEHRAPPPPAPPAPVLEPAARKMDVDENYDDSGDDKSATKQESQRNSPHSAAATQASTGGMVEQQA